ncbi:hypothetical protein HHK36_016143 [Tetracentron sinense]|uniref:BUB1 N-terminal domain-containing protein n=1 Tax=Tetracentron sinense TaxID=13715 RepID=A0A835DAR2_TETSI|nr:hypothetical protein HHK36_016143 [Tetracentron sinense]
MASTLHNDLFSSLISEIKTYTGKDPLLPWLRGVRKMRESVPPQILKAKLPRFLQKCAHTFESDRRYRNDLRYIRVWIQLMDFVDDPRALLRTMEMNRIGIKRSLFYQAYALCFEKLKKFEEAEKMYHIGVKNLAEPADELQKSYEQFLHRMELYKKRRTRHQERRAAMRPLTSRRIPPPCRENEEIKKDICRFEDSPTGTSSEISLPEAENNHKKVREESSADMRNEKLDPEAYLPSNNHGVLVNSCNVGIANDLSMKEIMGTVGHKSSFKLQERTDMGSDERSSFCSDDQVVVKFVDTAIVGKSEAENACHHGLVDPTINMKEAMNAINSMFREPLEMEILNQRRSHKTQSKVDKSVSNGFEVFMDENFDNGVGLSDQKQDNGDLLANPDFACPVNPALPLQNSRTEMQQTLQETFKIFIDDEDSNEVGDGNDENASFAHYEVQNLLTEDSMSSIPRINAFVFPSPKDLPSNDSDDLDVESSPSMKLREVTVVRRFMGSTILDEEEVENACHHGLVEPTINLKEAMDDINSMFGKPLDFVKTNRRKKQSKVSDRKGDCGGFSILPDEDLKLKQGRASSSSSGKLKLSKECDLYEPTVFTKEAMAEINEMFGMPLDF